MQARIEELESELNEARSALAGRPPKPQPKTNPWFGAPLQVLFEETFSGELSESALEVLVSIMRTDTGQLGRIDRIGGTLAWSIAPGRDAAARTPELTCEARDGRVRLRLAENQRGLAGGLFGGIVGGVGGGGLGIWVPLMATQLISPVLGLALVVLWVALIWFLVRLGFAAAVRARQEKLGATFVRLSESVERAATPARVAIPQRVEVPTETEWEAEAELEAEEDAGAMRSRT